jgi:hypothetical protein
MATDFHPPLVEPEVKRTRIEPDELPDLEERDPSLGDESPNVPWRDS